MTTIIVDWLGRGGIAQCTHAIARTLESSSIDTTVITVADRELSGDDTVGVPLHGNRVVRHRTLGQEAARAILRRRPSTVIIQNYVIPVLERPVVRAARAVGAQLVWFVHNHQAHSAAAGTSLGLRRNLEAADVVVTHSHFVADRVQASSRVDMRVLPLPTPEVHVNAGAPSLVSADAGVRIALHFGVLKRRYKGTGTFSRLAALGSENWMFAAVGVGAPNSAPGMTTVPRFVHRDELAATVAAASATILPYSRATQSAAVALSQHCGTVPVASAVGGITEQIDHQETGWLVSPGAPTSEWVEALEALSDDDARKRMNQSCVEKARRDRETFDRGVLDLAR